MDFVEYDQFISAVHQAKFKELPEGYQALDAEEVEALRQTPIRPDLMRLMPRQEPGGRASCPLPYELAVSGGLNESRDEVIVRFQAGNDIFKDKAAGGAFTAYACTQGTKFVTRNYAVKPGDIVEDAWALSEFDQEIYRIHVYGPNGYYWLLSGDKDDPALALHFSSAVSDRNSTAAEVALRTASSKDLRIIATDNSYGHSTQSVRMSAGSQDRVNVPTEKSHRWYDFSVTVEGSVRFERRFAGRIENGEWGFSDPLIGRTGL